MRLFFLLVVCLGLAGCKSQCRQLSEKLCECALNSNERSNCVNRAASAEGGIVSTAEQEAGCRERLQTGPGQCDCRLIETAAGKIRCGLARDPYAVPDSGV